MMRVEVLRQSYEAARRAICVKFSLESNILQRMLTYVLVLLKPYFGVASGGAGTRHACTAIAGYKGLKLLHFSLQGTVTPFSADSLASSITRSPILDCSGFTTTSPSPRIALTTSR